MREDRDPIPGLKEQLRREILAAVEHQPQFVAARRIGIDQPRMSDLERGRLERFSLEKLIRLLATIDRHTRITITPSSSRPIRFYEVKK